MWHPRLVASRTLRSLAVATAVLLIGGCKPKDSAPPPALEVAVAPVVQRDVPVISEWVGTLDGSVNADIRPKVEGYLLRELYKEGQFVRSGDPLFEIDPRQFRAAVEQAQGALGQADAQLSKAEKDVERFTPLAAERAVSQQELDNALSAQRNAQAARVSAQAAVDQAALSLAWSKITSPIAGIVGIAKSQVGDLVNPQTVMTTVSTVDPSGNTCVSRNRSTGRTTLRLGAGRSSISSSTTALSFRRRARRCSLTGRWTRRPEP